MSQQNIFIHLDEPIFLLTTRLLSPPPTYALEKNLQQQYKTPLTEAVKYDTAGQIVSWVGRASLHPTRPRVVVALSKFGYGMWSPHFVGENELLNAHMLYRF